VFGIPALAGLLALGWFLVKPRVIANTDGRIESVWTDTGPRYGNATVADPIDDTPSH
jgi:L-asparagine permease